MKITCSQSDLKTNLSLISHAVPSRPTHPVLANVLLVADEEKNKIHLTGFDLSLGIRTSFPAQIIEGGSVTLPAKLFTDIVSRLPEGEITLNHEEDEFEDNPTVSIISLSGSFQLRGMKGDEFPELPTVENAEPLMLPITALIEGLQGSLFAASSDETKQVLTGIHLTRKNNSLEFAATDGHRLAVVKTDEEEYSKDSDDSEESEDSEEMEEMEDSEETEDSEEETETSQDESEKRNFEITIPARALRELEQILKMAKEDESIALYVDEGQVVFELGEQHLTSRKLEGAYPHYPQLIPNKFTRTMVISRKTLISSLERVAVLADQKNNLVKFDIDENQNQVTLSVEAKELGSAKESIPAQITGEYLQIGFNIKYLMDGLKNIPSKDIQMNFNQAINPIIITPLGSLKMTYLIMPVEIKD